MKNPGCTSSFAGLADSCNAEGFHTSVGAIPLDCTNQNDSGPDHPAPATVDFAQVERLRELSGHLLESLRHHDLPQRIDEDIEGGIHFGNRRRAIQVTMLHARC